MISTRLNTIIYYNCTTNSKCYMQTYYKSNQFYYNETSWYRVKNNYKVVKQSILGIQG